MNKYLKNISLYTILGIILMISCVVAYDTANLKTYYSFDETNLSKIVDSINGDNLTSTTPQNYISTTGVKGSGIRNIGFVNTSLYSTNLSYNLDSSNSYTINVWLRNTSLTGGERPFNIGNSTNRLTLTNTGSGNMAYTNTTGSPYILRYQQTNNSWVMYTIMCTTVTDNCQLWINAELKNYSTYKNIITNMNKFNINIQASYLGFDELSIWDTFLSISDIALLYAEGNALSYDETIGFTNNTIDPRCIDSNTYCTNVGVNVFNGINSYFCNDVGTYCDSCIGSTCTQNTPQECAVSGSKYCEDSTSYATCDDSDSDGYLDLNIITTCTLGTYCVQSFNIAICKNVSSTDVVHDVYGIKVTPYSVSNENVTYLLDSVNRNVNVKTVFSIHSQQFYVAGSSDMNYISRTCNYKEENTQEMLTETPINESNTFILSSAVGTHSILKLSFIPSEFDNGTIEILSQASASMSSLKYYRNATLKKFCITLLNGTELYCDYDYTTSDTLKNVYLEYTFDTTSDTYTLKIVTNRTLEQSKILYPRVMSGNDVASVVFNSVDSTLKYFTISEIPQFNNYDTIISNGLTNSPCVFTSSGTYLVRTYGNNNGMPDYSTYVDYTVTIGNLGLTKEQLEKQSPQDEFMSGSGLSNGMKYLIVLVCILAIMSGFIVVGFTINMVQGSTVIGSVISTFALIMFTIFGWINAWVLILLLLVSVATIILVSHLGHGNSTG